MNESWKRISFEDCIEPVIYTTKVQRKDFLADGAYPVVSQEEEFINGFWDQEADVFRVERPLVVFGDHTRVLKYIDFDFVLGADGVKVLKPKSFLHPRFFYYQLHTAKLDSLGYARHYRLLKQHDVSFPGYDEQQRIAAMLDEAFECLATAKAKAVKNVENTRSLFKSCLESAFSQQDADWERARLQEVCTLYNGRAYNKDELLATGKYPVLRVGNFFTNKHWYYSDLELDEHKYCETGDLLYAWSASFGPRIWDGGKVIFHYHIWKVVPHIDRVERDFLKYLLEWDTEKIKAAQGTGTTMMHVSKASMDARVLPIPPLPLQRQIVAQLGTFDDEVDRLANVIDRKLEALDELKKSLLHQAFSGQLTAKGADRRVAEVV